jgi:hypothetical protein
VCAAILICCADYHCGHSIAKRRAMARTSRASVVMLPPLASPLEAVS